MQSLPRRKSRRLFRRAPFDLARIPHGRRVPQRHNLLRRRDVRVAQPGLLEPAELLHLARGEEGGGSIDGERGHHARSFRGVDLGGLLIIKKIPVTAAAAAASSSSSWRSEQTCY